MQRAILITLVLALLAGVVGVLVQLRELSFMSDALTHTVFPGVAIAFAAGQSLFVGALIAGAVSSVLLTVATRSKRIDQDSFLALLLAGLFSIGVVVISRHHTYSADLTTLLFGRLLAVDTLEVIETAAVALIALGVVVAMRKELLLRAFDEIGAEAMGYSLLCIDLAVNLVVALVVVAAARAVGTALVVAFLITPAATARLMCSTLTRLVATSVAVGAVGAWLGLVISYDTSIHQGWRLAPGATIVVVLTAIFAIVAMYQAVRTRAVGHETTSSSTT